MLDRKDCQAIDAARLYYDAQLSQADIAKKLGISRPTVSKLLTHARENGFVTITINDPREQAGEVITELQRLFNLEIVRIVRPATSSQSELYKDLGGVGAEVLEAILADGMSVGISWGQTLTSIAEHLRPQSLHDMKVVQLKGGHSHTERNTKDVVTLTRFARALDAEMMALPLPVILDSKQTKDLVVTDRHIAHMLAEGATTDVAVFTVGDARPESLLMNLGYLTDEEVEQLGQNAVGDVCSRFFDSQGNIADPEIDARTVGISIDDLRSRPIRLLVAGGTRKADAIATALRMGLATHLVIDHDTATRIANMEQM